MVTLDDVARRQQGGHPSDQLSHDPYEFVMLGGGDAYDAEHWRVSGAGVGSRGCRGGYAGGRAVEWGAAGRRGEGGGDVGGWCKRKLRERLLGERLFAYFPTPSSMSASMFALVSR